MYNKSKYLIKNIGLLTISNFSSRILVFLLVPLYTSILSTEEYGIYDLIVSTVTLLYPIFTVNIVDAVMRFSMDKNYNKKTVATIGMKFVLFSVIIVIISAVFFKYSGIWLSIRGLEVYICLYYISYVLNQYFIQFAKGLEKVADMSIAGIVSTIIMVSANIIFLLVFDLKLKGFLVASICGQAISAMFLFFHLKYWKYIDTTKNEELQKEMLIYCTPLIASVLGWWVNSTSDKYVVTIMCGVAANGILSVAYKIPQIINIFQNIFIQAWQISAIKEYETKDRAKFYGETFSVINVMMCAACACLIILTKPIASILYAKDFFAAWEYVPFLLISCVINSASGFLGPILSAKKASKQMAMSAVYGAIVNIILNVVLIWEIGVQGATMATVVASFVIYQVRKVAVGNDININGYTNILVTWILLIVQAILEIYTKLWYIEIGIMIVLLSVNFKNVRKIVNMCIRRNTQ